MKAILVFAILLFAVGMISAAPSVLLGGVVPAAAVVQTAGVPNLHTTTINLAPVVPLAHAPSIIATGHGLVLG